MTMIVTLLSVAAAEIGVLVAECIVVAGGAIAMGVLQSAINKIKNGKSENTAINAATEPQEATEAAIIISEIQPDVNVDTADVEAKIGEDEKEVEAPLEEARDIALEEQKNEEVTAAENVAAIEEQSEPQPQPQKRRSAAEFFAQYEKENGIEEIEVAQPVAEQNKESEDEFKGNVSELQQYLKTIKVKPSPSDDAVEEGIGGGKPRAEDGRLSYINPANPDGQGEEAFDSYSETDKDYLLRHIEKTRRMYASTPKVEHEKVDWDKVKEYNSAVLKVGEIEQDGDKE